MLAPRATPVELRSPGDLAEVMSQVDQGHRSDPVPTLQQLPDEPWGLME